MSNDRKQLHPLESMKIGGKKINIISEEAEEVDCVVCLRISELLNGKPYFTDDTRTNCAGCGAPILHHPHAPKKPPKVCASCALMLFPQDGEDAKAKMH